MEVQIESNSEIEKKTAAYLRVSTEKQEKFGTSRDNQLESVRTFAKNKGLILDEKNLVFSDAKSASVHISSAKDKYIRETGEVWTNRPQLKRLISSAIKGDFKNLIIYSHDRFTRSFQEFLSLQLFFSKLDIKVYYSRAGEIIDSKDDSINRFFELMLSNLAELEAGIIGSRVKLGQRATIEKNYWVGGRAPFGYSLVEEPIRGKNVLAPNEYSPIVEKIFNLYLQGHTLNDISSILSKSDVYKFTKKWNKSAVASILGNETYTGRLVWDRRGGPKNPVKHENPVRGKNINERNVLVKTKDWDEVLYLKDKQTGKDARYFTTPFLLKGKLICGKCLKPMKCKNNNKKAPTYYCYGSKKINGKYKSELLVKRDYIEDKVLETLREVLQKEIECSEDTLWNNYCLRAESLRKSLEIQENRIKKLIEENKRLKVECDIFVGNKNTFLSENTSEEYNEELFQSLESYKSHLVTTLNSLTNTEESIAKKLKKEFLSRETFKSILSDFLNQMIKPSKIYDENPSDTDENEPFDEESKILSYEEKEKLLMRQKRIFIDKILDRVILKSGENDFEIDLFIKFPGPFKNDFIFKV